jgi:hypothetical protein
MKWLIGLCVLCLSGLLNANSLLPANLTPPNQPQDNDFYVCYQKRFPKQKITLKGTCIAYHKLRYLGCIISRTPCHKLGIKKKDCISAISTVQRNLCENGTVIPGQPRIINQKICSSVRRYKLFYWFNNYLDALNGFYRCAYS